MTDDEREELAVRSGLAAGFDDAERERAEAARLRAELDDAMAEVDTLSERVDGLKEELADERARLDWLEEYRLGDNLDLMDEWDCDTLREAIDAAKGIES